MIEVTRKITVDLSRKGNVRLTFATQNDKNSRRLIIYLTDGGKPYQVEQSTVALVNFARPDGESGAFSATVNSDGSISVILCMWVLSVEGEVACSVSLFDGDERKLTSDNFYLDVAASLYAGDDVTEDESYSLLTSLMSDIAEINEIEAEREIAEKSRVSAEQARVNAENSRKSSETKRESAEQGRVTAENARADAESARVVAENARVSAENARVTAESARVTAENARKNAENARETAETKREETIGDIDSAVDELIEIQESLLSGGGTVEEVIPVAYPVGAIYMSVDSTSPAEIFGGTWEQLTSRVLVGAGDGLIAVDTGGSASITLTEEHLPSNTVVYLNDNVVGSGSAKYSVSVSSATTLNSNVLYYLHTPLSARDSIGYSKHSQQAIDTLPPYLAVYMWKRIA